MALVKELVKMLEGDIEVSSRVGAGTEFRVWLPVKRAAASAMTDITPAEKDTTGQITLNGDPFTKDESAGATKPAIVLAEDYDDLRSFISENLESGYRITALPDGLAAWHTIEEALPDLVITDMMMPGLDGNELCRRIKQGTSTAHIPVVMLTSRTAAEARLMGRGAGADVYLTKPFQVEELRLCLRNLLEQQERQRQYWKKEMLETTPVLPTPADEFSERLFSFLNENLDEPNLGVEMLASHMGMSRSTINRKMQSVMGMGTNDFIRHYRLKKAASILLAGYDVSQAAYQTGFSSPSYFSQRFREFFGKTPSEYASGGHLTQN
jgi:DNA-binding response OmpR family regulator